MVLRRRHVLLSVLEGESRDNEQTKPVRDKQRLTTVAIDVSNGNGALTLPSIRSEIALFANLAERSLGMAEARSAPPKEDDGSLALDRTLVFHEKRRSTGLIHEARLNNAIETLTST
ncbi:hypothetical protein V1477_001162 [Vespula maculifrons]|uniref:Uncharacterized protein n=1 Tax=Vespula maculifrons TaxID=7453 RepID=A0ABD2CZP1_VESMC